MRIRFTFVAQTDIFLYMKKHALFTSFIALFTAIICIGCFIKIPLGVVPVVLQNVLCILCAVLLGGFIGAAPTALFLLAGLVGLPVYSGGTGGIAVWLGPTGGFLPGYLLGALVAGLIAGKPRVEEKKLSWKLVLKISLAITAGMIVIYIPGVIRFAAWATGAGKVPVEKTSAAYAVGACLLPFIPGDVLKIVVAVPVALKLRPVAAQYLYSEVSE